MKPRLVLASTLLPDQSVLELHEHDQRRYLHLHGQQLSGPSSLIPEQQLAVIGCHPFRPARQPKVLVLGLGLGAVTDSLCQILTQKKAQFMVYEPQNDLVAWQRQFFSQGSFNRDSRVTWKPDLDPSAVAREANTLHAVLAYADTTPQAEKRLLFEDRRWLGAIRDGLQPGGILAISAMRLVPKWKTLLSRAGFELVEHLIEGNPQAKKPRRYPLLLARKPSST